MLPGELGATVLFKNSFKLFLFSVFNFSVLLFHCLLLLESSHEQSNIKLSLRQSCESCVYQLKRITKATLGFKLQLFFLQLNNMYDISIRLTRLSHSYCGKKNKLSSFMYSFNILHDKLFMS